MFTETAEITNGQHAQRSSTYGPNYVKINHPRYGVIWVGIESVTPTTADQYLKQLMPMQRKPKQRHLESMTRDMVNDGFIFTGEPIIFDVNGYMIQGQHRCLACVTSGESFDVLVVRGVPANAYEGMDITAKRTAADTLAKDNCDSATAAATITAKVASYLLGMSDLENNVHSPIVVRRVYQANREQIDKAARVASRCRVFRMGGQPFGYSYFRFSEIDQESADEFFDKLVTGEQLVKGDPILTLRNYLFNNTFQRNDLLRVLYYVWNVWRQGRSLSVIRVPKDATLPELV